MTVIIDGTNGIDKVAAGAIEYADLPAGSVLQVVNAFLSGSVSTTSTSLVTTGLTATITPKFATSKILVMVSHNTPAKGVVASTDFGLVLYKNGSSLIRIVSDGLNTGGNTTQLYGTSQSFTHVDSPATTSATTYTTYFQNNGGSSNIVNIQTDNGTIVLMEIAA